MLGGIAYSLGFAEKTYENRKAVGFFRTFVGPEAVEARKLKKIEDSIQSTEERVELIDAEIVRRPIARSDRGLVQRVTSGELSPLIRKLVRFRDTQNDTPEQIRAALTMADRERALRLAHKLKGVAGTIGATSVQQAAQGAETPIKPVSDAGEPLPALESVLSDVPLGIEKLDPRICRLF